jgi:hydrogenase maturation protease
VKHGGGGLVRTPKPPDGVKNVLILGLGNPLLGDEGIGVRVAEELARLKLPDGVSVVEGGTAGLGLIGLMEGYERVIVVDAADMGRPPGHVVRFTPSDAKFETVGGPLSLHQVGLGEVLALAQALEVAPAALVIIGVQPGRIEARTGPSPELEGAIPQIIRIVLEELKAAGISPALD